MTNFKILIQLNTDLVVYVHFILLMIIYYLLFLNSQFTTSPDIMGNSVYRMAVFAKRDILPGEEITYDYNFSLFDRNQGK